jgi:hypothetical protein
MAKLDVQSATLVFRLDRSVPGLLHYLSKAIHLQSACFKPETFVTLGEGGAGDEQRAVIRHR